MKNRWLLSTVCGLSLLAGSATAALAQNVPSENATAPTGQGNGAAPEVIQLKPGQEAGTDTVMPADTAGNPNASMTDAQFVKHASAGGMAEVMMGKLAAQRGQTPGERGFGRVLITDHTQANTALMGIAQTERLQPAPGPNAMQQAMYQRLQSAPAGQFDTMFNHVQMHGHERMIALFRAEAQTGQSPQLRHFAKMTLPVLQKHLSMAEQLTPMQGQGMTSMNSGMMNGGGMGMSGATSVNAPVRGNPDKSANQLNARELNTINHS